MAKTLMRLCTSLTTLSKSPKYLASIRLCHSENETKELTTVKLKTHSEAKKLFELLTNDNNPISLVVNIEKNKEKIDGRHVVTALTSMYKFYQTNKYPLENVVSSPQFRAMCNHLNKHVRTLEMPHLIQALKILNLFNVRSSTTIVQNLLQLIRVSINNLHPHEIYYLSFLLKRMNASHLSNAVYTALPEVFATRIKTKIDVENITELSNALKFAMDYIQDKEILQFLINNIHKYNGPIDKSSAIKIFQSISKNKYTIDACINIIPRIRGAIVNNLDNLNEKEIMLLVSIISIKTMQRNDEFYDPIFLDLLINQFIKNNYGLENGMYILGKINCLDHIHLSLLQHLMSKIVDESYIFTKTPKTMCILVHGLANANYKPAYWNELRDITFTNYRSLQDHVMTSFLALYIAALDDCNLSMIEYIFSMDDNPNRLNFHYHKTLCELYQIVKTLYPEYTGPWPMDQIVNSFKTIEFNYEALNCPLLPALNKIVENPACIKTNIRTNLGHLIDHLVVLQNGSPIAIESNVTSENPNSTCFVEDLNLPKDCIKIAICLLPATAYGKNIAIPKPIIRTKEKTLKAMAFKVVFISEDAWMSMPSMERIPYLQHVIGIEKKSPKVESSEINSDDLIKGII